MKITTDNVAKVLASIQELAGKQVLVGIPASKAERDEDSPLNNAQIGYIMENGAPASNIPGRPHLVPGVAEGMDKIQPRLRKAASAAMDGNTEKVDSELHSAGLIGQLAVQNKLNNGEFAPLSPSTVRNRRKSRKTKTMRDSEKKYLQLVADGSDPAQAQVETGIKPLINTGEYRDHITYVVRKKD